MTDPIHIIGGGLAGSEAAWQLAQAGVPVRLSEMRGSGEMTPAHHTDSLADSDSDAESDTLTDGDHHAFSHSIADGDVNIGVMTLGVDTSKLP